MRATLLALNEELIRLKASGVENVNVSDESIRTLRALAGVTSGSGAPMESAASALPVSPPSDRPVRTAAVPRPQPAPVAPAKTQPKLPAPPEVKLPSGSKQEQWDALVKLVQDDPVCKKSVRPTKQIVVGVGDLASDVFFCGEAPGAEEEVEGEPFVGPAGLLLDKMIAATGLTRESIFIGNLMNWRPQIPTPDGQEQLGNRPPTAEEMAYCLPYLKAQLEIVKPKVIVALGASAAKGLLGADRFKALGEIRGQWQEFSGTPVMVTYHPSYILRNQSHRSKRAIWEDLLLVMEKLELPISDKQRGYFLSRA
jgi:uracil-DNA glycosylase